MLLFLLPACTMTTDTTTDTNSAPTPTPTFAAPANDSPLTVTWSESGDLFAWRSGDQQTRRIASGGVIRPIIAPDGEWITFVRGPGGDPRTLWITDTPGANERQLVDVRALPGTDGSRRLNQIVWSGVSDVIYFNTMTGEGMDTRPADDLWRVDVLTGTGERLLPDGEGGQITLSPDGQTLALAAAGEYTQPGEPPRTPGRIALYTVAAHEKRILFEFPAVATASQTRWYPTPRWLPDSTGLRVAIPPPDLVYGGEQAIQTALWWFPTADAAAQTGAVDADFFGLPVFSPDGEWIAYLQRRTSPDQTTLMLMVAGLRGDDATTYAEGTIGSLTPPEWIPDQAQFLYGNGDPGMMWLGGPGADPIRFPTGDALVNRVIWADANTFVFAAPVGTKIALKFGLLDVPTPVQTITTRDTFPPFDAVLP